MDSKFQYATITVARNEQEDIMHSVNSILQQSIPPTNMVVVDDGSTDNTTTILKDLEKSFSWNEIKFKLVIRRDRGFSALGTYLMADVYNTGMKYLFSKHDWFYLFIISSDTIIPKDYAKNMIINMGDDYGVAGGVCGQVKLSKDACRGSGRVIRRDVLEAINGFPRTYAWEEGCLFHSWMTGLKTGHFHNASFFTRLPDAKLERNYIGWGRAMKDGGMTFIHLFILVLTEIIIQRQLKIGLKLLVGFFAQPYPKGYDWVDYRFVNDKSRLKQAIRRKMSRLLRLLP